jgi:hypothetical protein
MTPGRRVKRPIAEGVELLRDRLDARGFGWRLIFSLFPPRRAMRKCKSRAAQVRRRALDRRRGSLLGMGMISPVAVGGACFHFFVGSDRGSWRAVKDYRATLDIRLWGRDTNDGSSDARPCATALSRAREVLAQLYLLAAFCLLRSARNRSRYVSENSLDRSEDLSFEKSRNRSPKSSFSLPSSCVSVISRIHLEHGIIR